MSATLLLDAALDGGAAFLYLFIASRMARRRVSPDAQLASDLFAVWWAALGAVTLVGGIQSVLAAAGVRDTALFTVVTLASLLVLCVALWGLLDYLVFLASGRQAAGLLGGFYVLYYLALVYFVLRSQPVGVSVHDWGVTLEYAVEPSGWPVTVLLLLLVLPQILGAIGYFLLVLRVDDRTMRYRITVVSWSIIVWFTSPLVAEAGRLGETAWWPLVARLLGLAAAVAIFWAYRPPRWVQRRFGVRPLEVGPPRFGNPAKPPRGPRKTERTSPWNAIPTACAMDFRGKYT